MAVSFPGRRARRLELSRGEVTGALGDSITALPVLVALAGVTDVSLGHALLGFGAFQVVWGLTYGIPLSVEPMKALAGLAIAGGLTAPELTTAGLLAGGVLLALGRTGTLGALADRVGTPVVRGVQLAVALVLVEVGLGLAASNPGVAAAAVAVTALFALVGLGRASALAVLGLGGVAAVATAGVPAPSLPRPALFPAGAPALSAAVAEATVAQLAMTVGNAAVATSLLCSDLFDAEVSPDRLAGSMGAMNLLAVPLGGVPMCHGSGGLAGKHAFGARTGVANVVLGCLYGLAALVAGGGLLAAFPTAALGVLLVIVGAGLARTALDADGRRLAVGVALLGLLANVGIAFVAGVAVHAVLRRVARARPFSSPGTSSEV